MSLATGMPQDYTDTYRTIEEMGYHMVKIPNEVKENVPVPGWLELWEDAEYVAVSGSEGIPLGGNTENSTIKAAAYLASMTGVFG